MADLAKRFAALLVLVVCGGLAATSSLAAGRLLPVADPPPVFQQAGGSDGSSAAIQPSAAEPSSPAVPGTAEGSGPATPPEPVDSGEPEGEPEGHYLAPIFSSGEWFNRGCWYADGEFVLMHRTNPKKETLAEDTSSATTDGINGASKLTIQDGDFRVAPGARVTIGEFLGRDQSNRDQSVEFTFLGGFSWSTTAGIDATIPDHIFTPQDPSFVPPPTGPVAVFAGFNAADTQRFQYGSNLNSFEINVRSEYRLGRDIMVAMPDGSWSRQLDPGPTPSLLMGLRFIQLNENFAWQSRREGVPMSSFAGDYDIQTHNDLVGLQFGADWTRQEKNWRLGAWAKGGGFVNFSQQHSLASAINTTGIGPATPINYDVSAQEQAFTFVGEAGITGAYIINPHLSLRGDVQIMWLQSIAVAPKQVTFDFTAPPSVDLSGNSFFMGAGFGLEAVW